MVSLSSPSSERRDMATKVTTVRNAWLRVKAAVSTASFAHAEYLDGFMLSLAQRAIGRGSWFSLYARRSALTARSSRADAARKHLDLKSPGRAVIRRMFADPMERVGRDLGEAPAKHSARWQFPLLNDVGAARPSNLARVNLRCRITPEDMPGIEARIVELRSVVPYQLPATGIAGIPGRRSARRGIIQTSWIARPSSTQPK